MISQKNICRNKRVWNGFNIIETSVITELNKLHLLLLHVTVTSHFNRLKDYFIITPLLEISLMSLMALLRNFTLF